MKNEYQKASHEDYHNIPNSLRDYIGDILVITNELIQGAGTKEKRDKYEKVLQELADTLDTKVVYVEKSYSEAFAKNATKRSMADYKNSIRKAMDQIHEDINVILHSTPSK